MTVDFSSAQWRKSSRSSEDENSTCVEVAGLGGAIGVRDSQDPDGPKLAFAPADWRTFQHRVKTNKLDLT